MGTPGGRDPRYGQPRPGEPGYREAVDPRAAAPGGAPRYGPDGEPDPRDVPATLEDVRGVRRWAWIATAWAIAASAIALIALLAGGDDEGSTDARGTRSASRVERRVNERIDSLEAEVEELRDRAGSDEAVQELGGRVDELEQEIEDLRQGAGSDEAVRGLQEQVEALEQRVEELEETPPPDQP